MNVKKLLIPLLLALCGGGLARGGEPGEADYGLSRPIRSTYTLEIGRRHSLSTYLSPLVYTGLDVTLEGTWRKRMRFSPHRWEMEFRGGIGISTPRNDARNSTMLGAGMLFSWGMNRLWDHEDWRFGVGGSVGVEGGILYLRHNSNNPVSAMLEGNLSLTGQASRQLKLGKLPVTLFDRFSMPLAGLFFSPEYGETYYEIYLGNRKGLVNFGWPGNHFNFDNLLGGELHFGKRSLLLGWRFDLHSSDIHHIDTQLWRHSAVVGLSF